MSMYGLEDTGAYAKFEHLPQYQNNIITYLIKNNENIWKLLYYNTPDCLQQNNLTIDQKSALIYTGQNISTPYRVFMTDYIDDSFSDQCAFLRVYPYLIYPENRTKSTIVMQFDLFSHVKVNQIFYATRTVTLLSEVLKTFNGVGGSVIGANGDFVFSRMSNANDKAILNISNNKDYTGYSLLMSFTSTASGD